MHKTMDSIAHSLKLFIIAKQDQRMKVPIPYMAHYRTQQAATGEVFLRFQNKLRQP
jgi:hypothetical protein